MDAYDITADPTMFTRAATKVSDAPEQAAALLGPILDQSTDTVARKLRTKNTRYTLLAHRRTPQVWKQIKDLKTTLAAKAETDKSAVNFLAWLSSRSRRASACTRTAISPPGYWAGSTPTARAAAVSSSS